MKIDALPFANRLGFEPSDLRQRVENAGVSDETRGTHLTGPKEAIEIEPTTHCGEGTWRCVLDLVGCQGRNSELPRHGGVSGNLVEGQVVAGGDLRIAVRNMYTKLDRFSGDQGPRPDLSPECAASRHLNVVAEQHEEPHEAIE